MKSSDLINNFVNNQIFITNSGYNNYYHVFNGTLNKIQKWRFENNCLAPYISSLYKKDEFKLYDSDGSEVIEFNDAFTYKCILPSNEFTFSDQFSKSFEFTESTQFSKSCEFTKSSQFTFSFEFTLSSQFTNSFSLNEFIALSFDSTDIEHVNSIINSFSMSNVVSESSMISYIYSSEIFIENSNQVNNKNKSKGQLIGIVVGCIAAVLIIFIISIVIFIKIKKSRNQISDKKRSISAEEQTAKTDDKITFPQSNISENEDDLDFWL